MLILVTFFMLSYTSSALAQSYDLKKNDIIIRIPPTSMVSEGCIQFSDMNQAVPFLSRITWGRPTVTEIIITKNRPSFCDTSCSFQSRLIMASCKGLLNQCVVPPKLI